MCFVDNTNPAAGVSKQLSPKLYLDLFQVLGKSKNLEIMSLRTGSIHTVHKSQIRKININEFILEWSAENYIKEIVNLARFTKLGSQDFNKPLFNFDNEIDSIGNNDDILPVDNNEERLMDKKIMNKLIDESGDWKDKPPDLPDLFIPRTPEMNRKPNRKPDSL